MFCRKPLLMQGNLCLDVWLGIQVYQYTVYRIPVWFMGYLRIMYDCLPKPSLGLFGCVQKLDLTYHQFMASEVSSKKMTFWTNQKLACKNIWQCLMPVIDQVMIRYRKLYTFSSKNADQERPTSGTNCHEIHIGLLNFRGVIWQCVKTLYPWWTSK